MSAKTWPEPSQGDHIIKNFQFKQGGSLPELRLHYQTLGSPKKNENGIVTNAVLILHGTTGFSGSFFANSFAGQLFNRGQPLSAEDYYLILPDSIGHGKSSKPSDGLRGKFPRYSYSDMVRAQYMLLEHLGVNHLRLVMGTSMGGMHTWVWATTYPDFMDALMPFASVPTQIAGRNRMWRKHAIDSIRNDPEYHDGDYGLPPRGFRSAIYDLALMGGSPLQWHKAAPDRQSADKFLEDIVEAGTREKDANDFVYAFDASWDYDPRLGLANIKVPVTAVNSADVSQLIQKENQQLGLLYTDRLT